MASQSTPFTWSPPRTDEPGAVEVRCFPSRDLEFGAHVRRLVAASGFEALANGLLVEQLRSAYPNATVGSRDPMAELVPGHRTFYVFRDGSSSWASHGRRAR